MLWAALKNSNASQNSNQIQSGGSKKMPKGYVHPKQPMDWHQGDWSQGQEHENGLGKKEYMTRLT